MLFPKQPYHIATSRVGKKNDFLKSLTTSREIINLTRYARNLSLIESFLWFDSRVNVHMERVIKNKP